MPRDGLSRRRQRGRLLRELPRARERIPRPAPGQGFVRQVGGRGPQGPARQAGRHRAGLRRLSHHARPAAHRRRPPLRWRLRRGSEPPENRPLDGVLQLRSGERRRQGRDGNPARRRRWRGGPRPGGLCPLATRPGTGARVDGARTSAGRRYRRAGTDRPRRRPGPMGLGPADSPPSEGIRPRSGGRAGPGACSPPVPCERPRPSGHASAPCRRCRRRSRRTRRCREASPASGRPMR